MNNTFGNFSAQWSSQNQFWAWTDAQGNVFTPDNVGGVRQIGVSVDKYKQMDALANEATTKAEEYRNKLIEAGIIKVPPTQEEQIANLTAQVARLTQMIEEDRAAKTQVITQENTKEGISNGHLSNGESAPSKGQPVGFKDRPSTTVGVSAPAVSGGASAAYGTVRKVETGRS